MWYFCCGGGGCDESLNRLGKQFFCFIWGLCCDRNRLVSGDWRISCDVWEGLGSVVWYGERLCFV